MLRRDRLRLSLALLAVLAVPLCRAQSPAPAEAPPGAGLVKPGRALLLSGPESRRGLPFFPRNALQSLRGEYLLDSGRVGAWSCREALVFGPEWRPSDTEPLRAAGFSVLVLARPEAPVLAFRARRFVLFLEPPADGPGLRRFALALLKRFSFFFDNAADDAELSFPAVVDY